MQLDLYKQYINVDGLYMRMKVELQFMTKRLKLDGAEAYVYAQTQITSNNLDYKRY